MWAQMAPLVAGWDMLCDSGQLRNGRKKNGENHTKDLSVLIHCVQFAQLGLNA